MNETIGLPKQHPTTQATEGLPRLRWSLAEFDRLNELGVFTEDDRIELVRWGTGPNAGEGRQA
jgi:hypothetical protein